MNKNYTRLKRSLGRLVVLVGLLLSGASAQAQSGPVGNEWIVPGQQYYKMKVVRDGLYRIDYQYLTQAGITGVVPNELQVWRRGRQLATYLGGNPNVLNASTFLEFYAVHNDGQQDAELYKNPVDQPHKLYSFYTDTASYFITWSPGTAARHMQQPVATGSALHPYRLLNKVFLGANNFFNDLPESNSNFLPWIEPGEGFFVGGTGNELTYTIDSVSVNPTSSGTPRLEVLLFGAPNYSVRYGGGNVQHNTQVIVVPPTGPERLLGVMTYTGRVRARSTFALLPADIASNGSITIKLKSRPPVASNDFFFVGYLRTIVPQANTWATGRRSQLFENDSLISGPATYDFTGVTTSVVGFDVHDFYNVQRIVSTPGATPSVSRFSFPSAIAVTRRLLLADEATPLVPTPARRVRFRAINPATPSFIVITHPQLMGPAGGVSNAALAYTAYRASTAGGRYDTLMVTTQQLYDQFHYGDRSWLAMRHFARWLVAAAPTNTNRYLFLLGKGIVPSEPVAGAFFARRGESGLDLVPTNSRSVSDNLLTADYANNDFIAHLNTGRLTATTPAQVKDYLDKVVQYDATGDQPWRKNVLHLIGGNTPADFVEFRAYMDTYKQHVESPLFGGRVVATIDRRSANLPNTSLPVSVDISPYLNPGLGVISYFGHGSNTIFDLDIGYIANNVNYNNAGKYPVMFYNGCAAGHLFTVTPTFFESWLFTPGKGAIGAMGQYGFSYADLLDEYQDLFTRVLFNDPNWYGRPVTAAYNETARRLHSNAASRFSDPNDAQAVEQLLSTIWHGDPAISLYAPPKPDFQVSNATLAISPVAPATSVTANSPEFILKIGVTNPLKVTRDSVEIKVTRTVQGQTTVFTKTFAQGPQGSATYDFRLVNQPNANVFGTNTFLVQVDYANKVDEANETNNTAQTTFSFLRGGVTALNPIEFAIVGNSTPRLVAQTNDPTGPSRVFEFEADTSSSFTSSLVLRQQVTATLTPSWRPPLPSAGRDSVVWYWRVRFQTPAGDEDPTWAVSSFRVIQARTVGGWSQSHYAQFMRDGRQGVEVAGPNGRWAFSTEKKAILLATRGGGLPGSAPTFGSGVGLGITANVLIPPTVANCALNTPNLLIAVYDQRTLRPKTGLPGATVCGQAPQEFYVFGSNPANPGDTLNTLNSSATRQAQLATFLAAVPDGDYVAVVSMNRLRWASLTTVRTALGTLLGSQLVNQLQNGDPLVLLAQKRATGGRLIREAGPSTSAPAVPRYSQLISLSDTLRTPSSRGTITSTRIGPAQSWENLYHWIQRAPGATSSFTLKVIGIDTLNQTAVLFNNVPSAAPQRGGFSLASVSAARYPYLQLELTMQDSVNRTAPQLKEWFITYRGVPEGVVRRDLVPATSYDPATLAAQAASPGTITFPVKFENVTPFDFGTPLRAKVELRDAATPFAIRKTVVVTAPRQLKGDSTITIPVSVPMVGLFGTFVTKVTVNPMPRPLPEVNLFNNELTLAPFSVIDTNVPPTLDVAFDGRHILNGELVSSQPVINIQLNDEDRLRPITDRTVFTVTLRKPGQTGSPTQVDLNGTDVTFSVDATKGSVAKLEYRPGQNAPLADGVYTLEVQGRDPSNASAGSQNFTVKFEVVNAATITNVYPYPNPVINTTRFVFTVTGHEPPREMKIQVMTLTGRVVREIFINGAELHMGNNITDFAWDGTDSFGDRLANGTYLYRVSLNDPNGQFSHRDSAGDKAFKNDWGKLVLMR
ncbi:MAG: hypothetical protein JWR44_2288 [Hymenobacter sp.]|nr:hypothetical protein [Hymenobacter sp.]